MTEYVHWYDAKLIEGSLEVKLPTIWTDEKQRWEESERLERGRTKDGWGHLSTTFCIHSVLIYIELSLPPRCLSISCIHSVSYVDFPYWPLRHFLRFCCCNIRTSPASTTSCMHLVSISKFHPPRAIVSNKNHKQDNVSQFVGNLCELEGPRCLNRSTLGWGTLRVGLYGCNLHAAKCVKMSEAKTTSTIAGDETVLVSWELLKGLRLRDKCRCEGTYCYCFLSCINFVSYVDFPYWPLRHFLRFCCCNIRTSAASTTSCMHLVSISKFHPPRAIVSNKNHKQDNASQFVGNLCELEGPRCLNRSTLGWGTLRVGLYGCNLHAAKCVKMSEAKTTSTIAGDETVLVFRGNY